MNQGQWRHLPCEAWAREVVPSPISSGSAQSWTPCSNAASPHICGCRRIEMRTLWVRSASRHGGTPREAPWQAASPLAKRKTPKMRWSQTPKRAKEIPHAAQRSGPNVSHCTTWPRRATNGLHCRDRMRPTDFDFNCRTLASRPCTSATPTLRRLIALPSTPKHAPSARCHFALKAAACPSLAKFTKAYHQRRRGPRDRHGRTLAVDDVYHVEGVFAAAASMRADEVVAAPRAPLVHDAGSVGPWQILEVRHRGARGLGAEIAPATALHRGASRVRRRLEARDGPEQERHDLRPGRSPCCRIGRGPPWQMPPHRRGGG